MSQQNNQDPWGRRPNDGPPDLLALLKRLFSNTGGQGSPVGGGGSPSVNKGLLTIIPIVVVVLWALSGIFIVAPAEQAVVLRFGQYARTVEPGPHWLPRMIEQESTINVQQVDNFNYQAEMLTQDENIVSVAVAVQYRISNPFDFLFNVVDPVTTLRQATSSALRQVVGKMTLDAVLTTGRETLRGHVAEQIDQTMDIYHSGLAVVDVNLQPAKPPEAVLHAFDDAIKAREDEQTTINKAEAYQRQELSIVKGRVSRIMQQAKAYQQEVVLAAKGAVARYLAMLDPYTKSPTVTRERLYIDTLQEVLSQTTNVVVDNSKGNNVLYLPLDQILKRNLFKQTGATSTESDTALSENESATTAHSVQAEAGPGAYSATGHDYFSSRPSYSSGDY